MQIEFAKMEGAGNDFIAILGMPPPAEVAIPLIREMCHQKLGIGGDGIFWMQRTPGDEAQFLFRGFSCDGCEMTICINAFRCAVKWAVELGWAGLDVIFKASNRRIEARVDRSVVTLRLIGPRAVSCWVPLPPGSPATYGRPVMMGDPHLVLRVEPESLQAIEFEVEARKLRHWNGVFDAGANIHFIARSGDKWSIRSFEAGVEGETLACGSGCMAAALALAEGRLAGEAEFRFSTRGGAVIRVRPGPQVWEVAGPARTVFTGTWTMA